MSAPTYDDRRAMADRWEGPICEDCSRSLSMDEWYFDADHCRACIEVRAGVRCGDCGAPKVGTVCRECREMEWMKSA